MKVYGRIWKQMIERAPAAGDATPQSFFLTSAAHLPQTSLFR